jgi:hypothetical protein
MMVLLLLLPPELPISNLPPNESLVCKLDLPGNGGIVVLGLEREWREMKASMEWERREMKKRLEKEWVEKRDYGEGVERNGNKNGEKVGERRMERVLEGDENKDGNGVEGYGARLT